MRYSLGCITLALATAANIAPAWTAPSREALEIELSAIESVPNQKALARFGAGVEALLHEIVNNPSHRRLARNRALTVLRYYPSKATQDLLRKELERSFHLIGGLPVLDMQQALMSYAEIAGKRSATLLRRFLTHKNPDLRRSAAIAVSLSGLKAARILLRQRLRLEKSAFVRHALRQGLRRLSIKARTAKGVGRPSGARPGRGADRDAPMGGPARRPARRR